MLFAALIDEKSSHNNNEGKSTFQIIGIQLSKQTNKQANQQTSNKKEHLRLVINSIRVGVVSSLLEQLTFVLIEFSYKTLKIPSIPYLSVTIITFNRQMLAEKSFGNFLSN